MALIIYKNLLDQNGSNYHCNKSTNITSRVTLILLICCNLNTSSFPSSKFSSDLIAPCFPNTLWIDLLGHQCTWVVGRYQKPWRGQVDHGQCKSWTCDTLRNRFSRMVFILLVSVTLAQHIINWLTCALMYINVWKVSQGLKWTSWRLLKIANRFQTRTFALLALLSTNWSKVGFKPCSFH